MSDESQVGNVGWIDITVDNAGGLHDFYQEVVGWESDAVSMGEFSDYTMKMPSNGEAISGICHSRGSNVDLPRELAGGRFCVIEDPSGATAALYQP